MENKSIVKKLVTRKDIRERMSEQDARELLIEVRSKVNTLEEIESELRKIYDSPIEVLIDEDSRDILLFDESIRYDGTHIA